MTTKQPYPEEFMIEAAKQITERGHRVTDVSARLGVSRHSPYEWIKADARSVSEKQSQMPPTEEMRCLKAERKRVTEERDILKKAALSSTRRRNDSLGSAGRRFVIERLSHHGVQSHGDRVQICLAVHGVLFPRTLQIRLLGFHDPLPGVGMLRDDRRIAYPLAPHVVHPPPWQSAF